MTDLWVLEALTRVQVRLEHNGGTESLRVMAGMSDDELHVLARAETDSKPAMCHAPSLTAMVREVSAA